MNWENILKQSADKAASEIGKGKVADYIPALAEADPNAFGMAVYGVDGTHASIGQSTEPFSIQSISKIFTLSIALSNIGDDLWTRVGREPSGTAFNSVVQLEKEKGIPRNPLINAGALVVTDAIVSHCGDLSASEMICQTVRKSADSERIRIDEDVAASEAKWGDRNRSLAYFMSSFGNLKNPPESVLKAYFHQCALEMTVEELARAGLFLANAGEDPLTGEKMATREQCNRINALMMTCGHYDMSGDFAFRVGLPGKSGVGGGILAIAPGVGSVAVWSPALNAAGNSQAGTVALETFADISGLSVFSSSTPAPQV